MPKPREGRGVGDWLKWGVTGVLVLIAVVLAFGINRDGDPLGDPENVIEEDEMGG